MAKSIFVNLPVADVPRATAFYEAIGATKNETFSDANASCMVFSDTISVMLLSHPFFSGFLAKPMADAHAATGVLLAMSFDSREEVDAVVARALEAGGREPRPTNDMGFMYQRTFEDPDGHHWEPFWMKENPTPEELASGAPNQA